MKSLFESDAYSEMIERLEKLRPETKPLWGKMNSGQMLAHNTSTLEYACGDWHSKQIFIGKLMGGFMRKGFSNDKPFSKNGPTSPHFVFTDSRDFEAEKKRFIEITKRFHAAGPSKVTTSPHMFFGKLTADEWGKGMYKHLDHHFQQFGI